MWWNLTLTIFFSFYLFLSLCSLNLRLQFKNWNHFTDPLFLFLPHNHLCTFFISSLSPPFLYLFSICRKIDHLFHQMNVDHIKYRYCITKTIFRDACGIERHHHGYQNLGQMIFLVTSHNLIGLDKYLVSEPSST